MSNPRFTKQQRQIKDLIKNNKKITYAKLKENLSGDIRSPVASLLNKEEIRISGFEKKDKFNGDNLYFENRLPHKTIHDIILLFKQIESNDPLEYEKASKELIELFNNKLKEYETLEDETIDNITKNVVKLPLKVLIDEMDLISKKWRLESSGGSVDPVINEIKRIRTEYIQKYDNTLDETLGYFLYSYWPTSLGDMSTIDSLKRDIYSYLQQNEHKPPDNYIEWEEISVNEKAQILFLKPIYTNPLLNHKPLSGELPLYRIKKDCKPVVDLTGRMDEVSFLSKCGINKINRTFNYGSNLFYKLIFYIEQKNDNIIKNTLIKCLSGTTKKEETEHLIMFDKLIKKVEYLPKSPKNSDLNQLNQALNDGYNEELTYLDSMEIMGRDQFGRKIQKTDAEQLIEILKKLLKD